MRRKQRDLDFEQYIPRHGSYGKLRGETSERRKTARALKQQGLTYAQVGERMGISRQRAQQLVAPTLRHAEQIRQNLGDRCSRCGYFVGKMDLHHTDYTKDPDALLCTSCHRKKDTHK